jgi:hypothetical protein
MDWRGIEPSCQDIGDFVGEVYPVDIKTNNRMPMVSFLFIFRSLLHISYDEWKGDAALKLAQLRPVPLWQPR